MTNGTDAISLALNGEDVESVESLGGGGCGGSHGHDDAQLPKLKLALLTLGPVQRSASPHLS